ATRAPCPAAILAARTPPEPPPITNRSKSDLVISSPDLSVTTGQRLDPRLRGDDGKGRDCPVLLASLSALAILRRQHLHTVRAGDDGGVGEAEEEAVLDDTRDPLQRLVERVGVLDAAEGAIEDVVAAICHE